VIFEWTERENFWAWKLSVQYQKCCLNYFNLHQETLSSSQDIEHYRLYDFNQSTFHSFPAYLCKFKFIWRNQSGKWFFPSSFVERLFYYSIHAKESVFDWKNLKWLRWMLLALDSTIIICILYPKIISHTLLLFMFLQHRGEIFERSSMQLPAMDIWNIFKSRSPTLVVEIWSTDFILLLVTLSMNLQFIWFHIAQYSRPQSIKISVIPNGAIHESEMKDIEEKIKIIMM